MKYICYDCGNTFDEDEISVSRECIGSFWGEDAYQDEEHCPYCGSDDFDEYNEEEEEEENE